MKNLFSTRKIAEISIQEQPSLVLLTRTDSGQFKQSVRLSVLIIF